jgi:WD40 repeat protein
MQIFLKFSGRHAKALNVIQSITGLALKEEVSKQLGIPSDSLSFASSGRLLLDSHSIASQGIKQHSTLEVNLKLKGGGCGSSKSANVVDSTKSKEAQPKVQIPSFKRGEDPAHKPLEIIANAVGRNDSDEALRAIQQIEEIKPEDFRNPNLVAAKLIEIVCSREAEGIDQAVKHKLFAYIPNILNIMLQKSDLFTPNTKTSLLEAIENSLEIVKLDTIGGPELKFHMEMARNMIETFPASIDIGEVMNIIKDIASFGLSVFKLEVPLDETFSLGEKVFKWLRGKVRENAVKSFYELYLVICILSNNDIQEEKAEIEIGKLRTYTTKDSIRVGTILLIEKLIMKIRNVNTFNKLKDILIPLLSKDDNTLPVVLRICIELNDSNFPLKKEFQDWWGTYFNSNVIRFKASKSQLVMMLIDNNSASYLQVLNEDRSYLAGITYELYEKMISNFDKTLQDVISVYLDLSVAETKKVNDTLYDLHSKIIEFLDQRVEKVCIAFGDSGSGKSIYCNKLAHHLLTTKSGYLPIYVYLPLYKAKIEGDLVETVLKKYKIDLSKDLKSRKILFILDAYDELNSYPNIIVSNQIMEIFENSKVLFTCRTNEAPPNLNTFASKDGMGKPEKYSSLYIQPLSEDSIEHYARKVIELNIGWKSFDELWNIINRQDVLQLLSNPFLLGVCLKNPAILNNLNSHHTRINMVRTYQEYIKVYQTNEYERIDNQDSYLEDMQEKYTEASIEYAFKILEKGNLSHTDIPHKEIVKRGCLLKESTEKSYTFLHPSIGDYFVALGVIRIAKGCNTAQDVKQLNRVELMERYKVLDFIKEMMNECSKEDKNLIQKALFNIVRLRDLRQGLASSNALTILNYCGKSLHGQDLSGIYAKKANLRYACLINSNLNASDLEGANFSNADLYNVQMKNCNLIGVKLGTRYRDMKHSQYVNSVAVSSNNRYIISGSSDKTVKVWDFETGDLKHTIQEPTYVRSVAITTDNQYIASGGGDKAIYVWKLDSGELISSLKGHSRAINSVAISYDMKYIVSGSEDRLIKVWDFKTGDIFHTLEGHSDIVCAVVVSRDSRFIVSGSKDSTVKIWNLDTGNLKNTLEQSSAAFSVCITSDNKYTVSSSDFLINVWDLETGQLKRKLEGHSDQVVCLSISTDNQILVSSGWDSRIFIWDFETGDHRHTLKGHAHVTESIAISSDNQFIISGSRDCTIKIWNLESADFKQNLQMHNDFVTCTAFSKDNRLIVSGSWDNTVKLWEFETGELKHTLLEHSDHIISVAFTSDSQYIVSGSFDKTIKIWNLDSLDVIRTITVEGGFRSMAVSNDDRYIVSGGSKFIQVWEFSTGYLKRAIEGVMGEVNSVVISSDNRFIVCGDSYNLVNVWELETGNLQHKLEGHSEGVECVAISYDNKTIVSGSKEEEIKVWDLETGNLKYTIKEKDEENKLKDNICIVLSRNNKFIITSNWEGAVKIFDLETGDLINSISKLTRYIYSINLSTDDQYIVTGTGTMAVKVFKLQTDHSICLNWSTYQGFCAFCCEFEGSILSHELEKTLNHYRSNMT